MNIQFQPVEKEDFKRFREDVKEIFSIAVLRDVGKPENGEVIPDEDIDHSLCDPHSTVYHIFANGEKVGGIVLHINEESHYNSVDLFYIYPQCHSRGLGTQVWRAVEEAYPDTEVWELVTPYFEKRNIHFYVNKCGFRIVEFFCKYHPDPAMGPEAPDFQKEYFRFEKRMR